MVFIYYYVILDRYTRIYLLTSVTVVLTYHKIFRYLFISVLCTDNEILSWN